MEPIMQFFALENASLLEPQKSIEHTYYWLALKIVEDTPRSPERTVALRKLLESKDAALRAATFKETSAGLHTEGLATVSANLGSV